MKTNLSRANQIECMICDDIIQTIINVFCGIPTFIINNNGLSFGYKTIIDGVVNSCFLSKKNLMKIDDKKALINTVFYRFNDIENLETKFSKAKVIEISRRKKIAYSFHDNSFAYELGQEIEIEDFDLMYNVECSTGIHFFLTRDEAVRY